MEIIIIAAMAANRVIGDSTTNIIPWHIPGEQERFKEETMGHPLIMGRKTYESIGRPLPGRQMVIITRNRKYKAEGCLVTHTPNEAIACCQGNTRTFIIGGETIYRQTMPYCHQIILTTLARPAQGDIFFPKLPEKTFTREKLTTIKQPESYTVARYHRNNVRFI